MTAREREIARFRQVTRNVSTTTTILFWVFAVCAIGLLFASFFAPPTGEIHPSALKGASILFAFAALAEAREAIREGLGVKLTHGQTTIEVHDLDGHPAEEPKPEGE